MRFMPPWEILDPPLVIVMCLPHWEKIIITVVDPGFPMGAVDLIGGVWTPEVVTF